VNDKQRELNEAMLEKEKLEQERCVAVSKEKLAKENMQYYLECRSAAKDLNDACEVVWLLTRSGDNTRKIYALKERIDKLKVLEKSIK
jgi:hypothetical protein